MMKAKWSVAAQHRISWLVVAILIGVLLLTGVMRYAEARDTATEQRRLLLLSRAQSASQELASQLELHRLVAAQMSSLRSGAGGACLDPQEIELAASVARRRSEGLRAANQWLVTSSTLAPQPVRLRVDAPDRLVLASDVPLGVSCVDGQRVGWYTETVVPARVTHGLTGKLQLLLWLGEGEPTAVEVTLSDSGASYQLAEPAEQWSQSLLEVARSSVLAQRDLSTRQDLVLAVFDAQTGLHLVYRASAQLAEFANDYIERNRLAILMSLLVVICLLVIGFISQRAIKLNARLHQLATTDGLTGLLNHRTLVGLLGQEMERSQRQGSALTVLQLDLDYFKSINDRYSHQAGDAVLRHAAQVFGGAVRTIDSVGRTGGEEFVVVLPGTDLAGATTVAERILARLRAEPVPFNQRQIGVTCSIGVARFNGCERLEDLLARADLLLYQAKAGGRDRCVVEQDLSLPLPDHSHAA